MSLLPYSDRSTLEDTSLLPDQQTNLYPALPNNSDAPIDLTLINYPALPTTDKTIAIPTIIEIDPQQIKRKERSESFDESLDLELKKPTLLQDRDAIKQHFIESVQRITEYEKELIRQKALSNEFVDKAKIKQLEQQIKQYHKETKQLKKQLEKSEKKALELNTQAIALQTTSETIRNSASQEIRELFDRLKTSAEEKQNLISKFEETKNQISAYFQEQIEIRETANSYQQEFYQKNITERDQQINALTNELHKFSTIENQRQVDIGTLNQQLANQIQKSAASENQAQQVQIAYSQILEKNNLLSDELILIKKKYNELLFQQEILQQQITILNKNQPFQQSTQAQETLQQQINIQTEEIKHLKQQLIVRENINNQLTATNQEILNSQTQQSNPQRQPLQPTMDLNIADLITTRLQDLSSSEHRESIGIYSGRSDDIPIRSWIREAEYIAVANDWPMELRRKYIGSRLKGNALAWHVSRITTFPRETYQEWKTALLEQFKHPGDIEKLKHKFNTLKQAKSQQTRHFIEKIKTMYQTIYNDQIPDVEDPLRHNPLRDDILLKVLMQGLLPDIKEAMWNGRLAPEFNWYQATAAAIEAEKILIAKELTMPKTLNAIGSELNTSKENEVLKQIIKELTLKLAGSSQSTDIAAISDYKKTNVHFDKNTYSRNHVYLDPKQPAYWNFSYKDLLKISEIDC